MTARNLWMQTKGVKINAGKLTLTDTSVTWRASYQRKNRTKTIPWEKFSEIILATQESDEA